MNYSLITGASSGIGQELARIFAKNGHNLILVARQENKLMQLSEELGRTYKIKVRVNSVDLSDDGAADEVFNMTKGLDAPVNYLVNNAGFYVKGAFSDTSWDEEQKLIQLQCITHTKLIKLFLPEMLKQGKGGILNVGSTGSFVPGPYNAVYCAAKSFVLSFSEALAEELKNSGITVTAVCPGGTRTNFQAYDQKKISLFFPVMDASKVAASGYKALMKGKRVVIPGRANRIQVFISHLIPRTLMVRLTGAMITK